MQSIQYLLNHQNQPHVGARGKVSRLPPLENLYVHTKFHVIHQSLRYFSLDQSGGLTDCQTDISLPIPKAGANVAKNKEDDVFLDSSLQNFIYKCAKTAQNNVIKIKYSEMCHSEYAVPKG